MDTNKLSEKGYLVLRFNSEEIINSPSEVLCELMEHINPNSSKGKPIFTK